MYIVTHIYFSFIKFHKRPDTFFFQHKESNLGSLHESHLKNAASLLCNKQTWIFTNEAKTRNYKQRSISF